MYQERIKMYWLVLTILQKNLYSCMICKTENSVGTEISFGCARAKYIHHINQNKIEIANY